MWAADRIEVIEGCLRWLEVERDDAHTRLLPLGACEARFGRRHAGEQTGSLSRDQPVEIDLGGPTLRLTGRIDRIARDQTPPTRFRVIEYKTGRIRDEKRSQSAGRSHAAAAAVRARRPTAQRERIATAVHENLCVEAAAGTGKTTVLVDRVVSLLATGAVTVDELVVITFTEKAAASSPPASATSSCATQSERAARCASVYWPPPATLPGAHRDDPQFRGHVVARAAGGGRA